MSLLIHLIAWVFYIIGGIFYLFYSLLQFVSKPGTRYLFPIALIILVVCSSGLLTRYFTGFAHGMGADGAGLALTWGSMAVFVVIGAVSYILLSRLLALILGIFPPVKRPIFPLRKLTAPKGPNTKSAAVKVVVPTLKRR